MSELTRAAWAHLIPHAGAMCLVDAVRAYDATSIICVTRTHCRADNPLRHGDRLASICGIEYAAQAAAIHGGLTNASAGRKPKSGYLAAVRGLHLHTPRLDGHDTDLVIRATQIMIEDTSCIYEFALTAGERELLRGRLTVVQDF